MDFLNLRGACCAAAALIWCVPAIANQHSHLASPDSPYDLRRLMSPTPAEVASEGKGHIHILSLIHI